MTEYFRRLHAVWKLIFTSSISLSFAGGCSDNISCVETATCSPDPAKDASGEGDASPDNAARDSSSEAGPVYDGSQDRADVGSADQRALDTAIEGASPSSEAGADARAGNDGSARTDGANEAGTSVDVSTPTVDVTTDNPRDATTDRASNPETTIPDDGATVSDAAIADASVDLSSDVAADSPVFDATADNAEACDANACGGCGPLGGVPGSSCGQCGRYECAADKNSVKCDDPGYIKYKEVAFGSTKTCGLTTSGGVRCWGGTTAQDWAPPATDFLSDVDLIDRDCAVMVGGGVRCWGYNQNGRLGNGTDDNEDWTTPANNILVGIQGVASDSRQHTCSLSTSGDVRCWGYNAYGQLGIGSDASPLLLPSKVILSGAQRLAVNRSYSCALMNDSGVRCWGTISGDLGDNPIYDPSAAMNLLSDAKDISAGFWHTCTVVNNGDAHCWGDNSHGQLGDGTKTTNRTAPGPLILGGTKFVRASETHTCALSMQGEVRCWGQNSVGELGNNDWAEQLAPKSSPILTGATQIAVSESSSCALLTTGRIRCWGGNSSGALGDGTNVNRNSPVEIKDVCP